MAAPQIQFQHVGDGKKQARRVLWSTDGGQTWHEPEEASVEVARAWQDLQQRQQAQGK